MPPGWIAPVAAVVAILLIVIAAALRRGSLSSAERELNRRKTIHEAGRMASGLVTEFHSDTVHFQYTIRGIEYEATQDISGFRKNVPRTIEHLLVGPCSVKYLVENPANSIVISEGWNGLRPAKPG